MSVVTIELIAEIKRHYRLKWHGTHGILHWNRVHENGMKLAEQDGVNVKVVQLFAVFHDSQRKNEQLDKHHGKRGAELAIKLRKFCHLNEHEFNLLKVACSMHTSAMDHDDITVQSCFDSDRLDLGRVGIVPDANLLCTPMAKMPETIKWGFERSQIHELPEYPFGLAKKIDV